MDCKEGRVIQERIHVNPVLWVGHRGRGSGQETGLRRRCGASLQLELPNSTGYRKYCRLLRQCAFDIPLCSHIPHMTPWRNSDSGGLGISILLSLSS